MVGRRAVDMQDGCRHDFRRNTQVGFRRVCRRGAHRDFRRRSLQAFTLLELLVVLAILSILFFIVTPRFFSSVNPATIKNFVRRMHNTLRYADEKAVLEKKVYLFTIDLKERRYFFTVSEAGNPEGRVMDRFLAPVPFPKELVVESVQLIPGDKVDEGKAVIPFTPKGMLTSFEIIIKEKGDTSLAVRGNSLSGSIDLLRLAGKGEEKLY